MFKKVLALFALLVVLGANCSTTMAAYYCREHQVWHNGNSYYCQRHGCWHSDDGEYYCRQHQCWHEGFGCCHS